MVGLAIQTFAVRR